MGRKCKWTREACEDAIKECVYQKTLIEKYPGAYNAMYKNGWNDLIDQLKPYWDPDRNDYKHCYESAKNYTARDEFRKGDYVRYMTSLENGWLDSFVWFIEILKPSGYWDHDKCEEECKKYKSSTELLAHNSGCYDSFQRNGWIPEFFPETTRLKNKNNA